MSLFPLDHTLTKLVRVGALGVIDPAGKRHHFGEPLTNPDVVIRLHDTTITWQLALQPDLKLGEAYVDGRLTIEQGSLGELLRIALLAQNQANRQSHSSGIARGLRRLNQAKDILNSIGQAERNVRHHYDIGQNLYRLFLDSDLNYSCGYWRPETTSLEQAQADKKRHIALKLLLKPGMRVLDIGSGWGGLALHLAQEYGVAVTGLTLSRDQFEISSRRAEAAGLQKLVRFKLLDYRQEVGAWDRIVSVGMFEHVGRAHFRTFFRKLDSLLAPDGIALIHTIGKMWDPGPTNPWIRRYIFPGGYIPTLSELLPPIERTRFLLTDLENWRLHYASTLAAWNARFQQHRDEVARMFDERFCRMWEFYLQGCEASFRYQEMCVFQLQLAKSIDTVPTTRDYLYAVEPGRASDNVVPMHAEGSRNRLRD